MKSTAEEYHPIIGQINDRLKCYLSDSQEGIGPVLKQISAAELAEKMNLLSWISKGGLNKDNLDTILDVYLSYSQRMHHPHYIGHQVSVPHLASGISDFIHGSINNPMAIYEMGPSASVIEKTMVNWMLDKVGWFVSKSITEFRDIKGNGTGVFTHGGSLANLTAMLAARAYIAPKAWEEGTPSDLVVLAPAVSHYSISRSISIMGLGNKKIISVPVDELERMKVKDLRTIIKDTLTQGKRIMAVIANACATTTGLHDPLYEIGQVCKEYGLWFHVDGAHGASALISSKEKHFLNGIELADSMIWDTHKMLRTSTLSAAVLFKNPKHMINAFQQKGSYLFHEKENKGFDLMPYTIECTKAPLATKLFWVLAAEGEKGLVDFIESQYAKTRMFYNIIKNNESFECPYYPEANILCFRYNNGRKSNEYQLALRNSVVETGMFYITSAELSGIRYLRLTVINPLTAEGHIHKLLEHIEVLAKEIV